MTQTATPPQGGPTTGGTGRGAQHVRARGLSASKLAPDPASISSRVACTVRSTLGEPAGDVRDSWARPKGAPTPKTGCPGPAPAPPNGGPHRGGVPGRAGRRASRRRGNTASAARAPSSRSVRAIAVVARVFREASEPAGAAAVGVGERQKTDLRNRAARPPSTAGSAAPWGCAKGGGGIVVVAGAHSVCGTPSSGPNLRRRTRVKTETKRANARASCRAAASALSSRGVDARVARAAVVLSHREPPGARRGRSRPPLFLPWTNMRSRNDGRAGRRDTCGVRFWVRRRGPSSTPRTVDLIIVQKHCALVRGGNQRAKTAQQRSDGHGRSSPASSRRQCLRRSRRCQ